MKIQNHKENKLPFEYPLAKALDIYRERLHILSLVLLLNFIVFIGLLLVLKYTLVSILFCFSIILGLVTAKSLGNIKSLAKAIAASLKTQNPGHARFINR